jgi:uncharacterized membrane protein YccC
MVDAGIGVAIGLAVNVVVFPPLQLRPAERAIPRPDGAVLDSLEKLT